MIGMSAQRGAEREKAAGPAESRIFRELFENINSGVAIYDAVGDGRDFVFKYMNKAGQKFSNAKLSDIKGKSVLKVFPGIRKIGLFDVFREVWKTGKAAHHPLSLYEDERRKQWVRNYVFRLPDGEIAAVYDDITEQVEAENRLRENEKKYKFVVDNIHEMILIVGKTGKIHFANRSTLKNFGYNEGEIIGKNIAGFLTAGSLKVALETIARELTGDMRKEVRVEVKAKDGSLRIVKFYDASIPVYEGGKVIGLLVNGHDVTEQEKVYAELRESEETLRSIFDGSNDGIFIHDMKTGDILKVNRKACEMFGFTQEQALKLNVGDMSTGEKGFTQEDAVGWVKKAWKSPQIFEWRSKDVKGNQFWTEVTLKKVTIGGHERIMAAVRDISDKKRSEQEIKKRAEELEKFNRLSIGRELRMVDLKDRIRVLEEELKKNGIAPPEQKGDENQAP